MIAQYTPEYTPRLSFNRLASASGRSAARATARDRANSTNKPINSFYANIAADYCEPSRQKFARSESGRRAGRELTCSASGRAVPAFTSLEALIFALVLSVPASLQPGGRVPKGEVYGATL